MSRSRIALVGVLATAAVTLGPTAAAPPASAGPTTSAAPAAPAAADAPTAAAAAATAAAAAARTTTYRLWMTFDSGESLTKGSRVVDASRYARHGVVRTAHGGQLKAVAGYAKSRSARFPAKCSAASCPNALIDIADSDVLDPGYAAFDFGVRLRLRPSETTKGSNLIQKGLWGERGGQWKLQVDGHAGKPSCVVSGYRAGTYRRVTVTSPVSVSDDRWHLVTCRRSAGAVELWIDGVRRASAAMAAVRLASTATVTIGAKDASRRDNDQFYGLLDTIFVRTP